MSKLLYVYDNGKEVEHTKFVKDKTMMKESEGSKLVTIYKYSEQELYERCLGFSDRGKFITSICLK